METQMVTSCGILVKHDDRYVLGHATGQSHYDIFKGRMEKGETHLETALRECQEESGLIFVKSDLHDLGLHDYIKNKMLYLYIAKISDLDISSLVCSTYYENDILEMDHFESFDFEDMLTKVGRNMRRIFISLEDAIQNF